MRIGFLGAGKMATAIAGGMAHAGIADPRSMIACDLSAAAREAFQSSTGVRCDADTSCLTDVSVLVLAVKPQGAREAVASLPDLASGVLVISIAAGIHLGSLCAWLDSDCVIRVMPNTPLLVGKGATVFAAGPGVSSEQKALATEIFGSLGLVREVEESSIDAVTALSGSGPAYVFAFVEALSEAGHHVGLSAALSEQLAIQTLVGAAAMLAEGIGSPAALRQAVTSPGGTTAAGLAVLDAADFGRLIMQVVTAARDRSAALGRLD